MKFRFRGDTRVTISLSTAEEALKAMEKIAEDENGYVYRRMLDARNVFFSAKGELKEAVDEGWEKK
jgi:hypothetical protein